MKPEIRKIIEEALSNRKPNRDSDEYYPNIDKMDGILKNLTDKLKENPNLKVFIPCCGAVPWEYLILLDAKLSNNPTDEEIKDALTTITAYDLNKTCVKLYIKYITKYVTNVYGISTAIVRGRLHYSIIKQNLFDDKGSDISCVLSCNPPFYKTICKSITKHILNIYPNCKEISMVVPRSTAKWFKDTTESDILDYMDTYGIKLGVDLAHLRLRRNKRKTNKLIEYVNSKQLYKLYMSRLVGCKHSSAFRFIIKDSELTITSSIAFIGCYTEQEIKNIMNNIAANIDVLFEEFSLGRAWGLSHSDNPSLYALLNAYSRDRVKHTPSEYVKIAYTKYKTVYGYKNWENKVIAI